jgi:uncharacterized Zn finger protein (UPF0148 family)
MTNTPTCSNCGRPLTREHTGMLSMSVSTLCADCERSA